MATKINYFYITYALLITICFTIYASLLTSNADINMIDKADYYSRLFQNIRLESVVKRSNYNYYLCQFNNKSSFIVGVDGEPIRIQNNMKIISKCKKDFIALPDSLQKLVLIVNSMYKDDIEYIQFSDHDSKILFKEIQH